MRLKFTYLFFIALAAWILLRSDSSGRTSSSPQMAACGQSGCHSTSQPTGTTTIDSIFLIDKTTNLPVTQYVANTDYGIGFIGKYVGTGNLPKFGFIVSNGGKGNFSGASSNCTINTSGGIGYWGHSSPKDSLFSFSVVGINTFFYADSCTWTAPASGSGTVTFSGFLNAVNNNSTTSGDKPNSTIYTRTYTEASNNAGVSVAILGPTTLCQGETKTFFATPTNGGTAPTYQWYINGSPVGTGGISLTTSTLQNNDSVWVVMTSNKAGVGNNPATSNKVKVIVNPTYNNQVTISANKTTVCAGDTVNFTATPGAGVSSPTYRWYLNNGTNPIGSGVNFQKIGFAVGDSISCRLTVMNNCASPNPDTSNYIRLTVNTSPIITGNTDVTICNGDSSTATNWTSTMSGTTYTWTNSNTTIGLPASGTGQIGKFKAINTGNAPILATITIRSSAGGCTGAPVTYRITVNPSPRVRVPKVAPLCHGDNLNVSFNTIPFGSPKVAWYTSGTDIGIGMGSPPDTGNIFKPVTNNTNDSIVTTITMRAILGKCVGPDSTFNVTVYPNPTMNPISDTAVCDGKPIPNINFTSSINGIIYNWTNTDVSINLASSGIGNINGFTAANTGTAPKTATITVTPKYKSCNGIASSFKITVNKSSPPDVTIKTNDTLVCPGGSALFTATPINGGSMPNYQWFKNGTLISGATKDTCTISNIANNDQVFCILTSNSDCATVPTDTSATYVIKTIDKLVPKIVLSVVSDTICQGGTITVNSTVTNGGTSPTYQWYLNGNLVSGATGDFFIGAGLSMNDILTCELTSSLGCANPNKVISNSIKVKVFPIVSTEMSLTADKKRICSDENVTFTVSFKGGGLNPKVNWTLNGQQMNTNVRFITVPINSNTDVVKVEVKSSEVCVKPAFAPLTMSIDTVDQGPYVNVFPDKYWSACQGDSIRVKVFNGQPNYNYLWSNGFTVDSFWSRTSMSYTLKVTETGNRCPRYYGPLTTFFNDLPMKPSITANNGILKSSIADRYQWQLNKLDIVGADTQTFKYPIAGSYRVKVTNSAGCANYSDEMQVWPVSISQGKEDRSIQIFPNPTTGILNISSQSAKIETIWITDLTGRILRMDDVKDYARQIQLNDFPKGQYFLRIKTKADELIQKIDLK